LGETRGADSEVDRTALRAGGERQGAAWDLVWFGGYTRSPAAVTGPHLDARITPGSTIHASACVMAPWSRVTAGGVRPTDVVVGLLPLVAWVAL